MWIVILTFLIGDCSKSISQKTIDKLVSQLQTGSWDFKFPKENVLFRERSFFLKNPQTYEAEYEVWDNEEERLLECYVEYTLVDTLWKFNSIFIDGEN